MNRKLWLSFAAIAFAAKAHAQSSSGGMPIDQLPPVLGPQVQAQSLSVTIASNQPAIPVTPGGRVAVEQVRNDYGITPVTTGAYVQLIAATSGAATAIEIFDSSGQTMSLAFGAPGSEVQQALIFPGGNGLISLVIPVGTRVSIKAVSANATVGEIDANLYN